MATSAEQLILRGLSILLRINVAPREPTAASRHLMNLQNDIGPWFKDYAEEIEKPAVDFTLTPIPDEGGGGGLQQ